jgi:hypothetical protein
MNHPRRRLSFIVAGLLTLAGAVSLVLAAASTGRTDAQTERTQQRIDALLKHRLKPDPLPVTLPNPFQVVSGTASRKADGSEAEAAPTEGGTESPANSATVQPVEESSVDTSKEALARYAAKLKIGGLVRLNGQPQLIINDSPRKEGDFIIVEHKDAVTYVQIVRIAPCVSTRRSRRLSSDAAYFCAGRGWPLRKASIISGNRWKYA